MTDVTEEKSPVADPSADSEAAELAGLNEEARAAIQELIQALVSLGRGTIDPTLVNLARGIASGETEERIGQPVELSGAGERLLKAADSEDAECAKAQAALATLIREYIAIFTELDEGGKGIDLGRIVELMELKSGTLQARYIRGRLAELPIQVGEQNDLYNQLIALNPGNEDFFPDTSEIVRRLDLIEAMITFLKEEDHKDYRASSDETIERIHYMDRRPIEDQILRWQFGGAVDTIRHFFSHHPNQIDELEEGIRRILDKNEGLKGLLCMCKTEKFFGIDPVELYKLKETQIAALVTIANIAAQNDIEIDMEEWFAEVQKENGGVEALKKFCQQTELEAGDVARHYSGYFRGGIDDVEKYILGKTNEAPGIKRCYPLNAKDVAVVDYPYPQSICYEF